MKRIFAAFLVVLTLSVCAFELIEDTFYSIGQNTGCFDTNMDHEDENSSDELKTLKECLTAKGSSFSPLLLYSQKHLVACCFDLPKQPEQWIFSPPPNSAEL